MGAHRVTSNWLVGLTRIPELVDRFPFLRTLGNKWRVHLADCGSCGQKAAYQQFGNQANEAAKILASIPEDDIAEFKRMAQVTQLSISYIDVRGQQQHTLR